LAIEGGIRCDRSEAMGERRGDIGVKVLWSGEEVMVVWWGWLEGEMRSSKIDSETGGI
jgi:hypothetical protein